MLETIASQISMHFSPFFACCLDDFYHTLGKIFREKKRFWTKKQQCSNLNLFFTRAAEFFFEIQVRCAMVHKKYSVLTYSKVFVPNIVTDLVPKIGFSRVPGISSRKNGFYLQQIGQGTFWRKNVKAKHWNIIKYGKKEEKPCSTCLLKTHFSMAVPKPGFRIPDPSLVPNASLFQ